MKKPVKTLVSLLATGVLSSALAAEAVQGSVQTELFAPREYVQHVVPRVKDDYRCPPAVQPFSGDLNFRSKYEGSDRRSRAVINDDAEEAYKKSTEAMRDLEKQASRLSDQYVKNRNLKAGQCLIDVLDNWAQNSNMDEADANGIGQAVRKWMLAATGISYLKVTQAGMPVEPEKRQRIEHWFSGMAEQVMDYYSDRPIRKVNNHDYWAAWAVMVTAVNTQNHEMFDWSVSKYQEAMSQVTQDGFWPNELRRNQRALSYSNFALQPIVMMSVFARANHVPESVLNYPALHRAVEQVLAGIDDPEIFQKKTSHQQMTEKIREPYSIAWLEPYLAYYPAPRNLDEDMVRMRPLKSTRLGGDLSWMYEKKDQKK